MKAVEDILGHNQLVFNAMVKEAMPKYNQALKAKLEAEYAEQRQLTADMRRILKGGFSKKDFKRILKALHTDHEVDDARRDVAFNLVMKLAPLFSGK
jgi:hypothetical protein